MQGTITRFLNHLQHERRLSMATVQAYRRDLNRAAAYYEKRNYRHWPELNPDAVRGLIGAERRRGQSARSIQRLLAALRALYRYLLREGEVSANPAAQVRAPKIARKLPATLDVDEVAHLLAIPLQSDIALRDRAILELFYSSALRLTELTELRWIDLDTKGGMLRVTGKGAKTRQVPLGRMAAQALIEWRSVQKTWPGDEHGYVFSSRRGGCLSQRAVQARLAYWAKRQGLWKKVYPHLLRHSCATHVLESSGQLRAVQELLGHADIATTQIYTHLDFQHLAKVYDRSHPRAQRKRGDGSS